MSELPVIELLAKGGAGLALMVFCYLTWRGSERAREEGRIDRELARKEAREDRHEVAGILDQIAERLARIDDRTFRIDQSVSEITPVEPIRRERSERIERRRTPPAGVPRSRTPPTPFTDPKGGKP